MMQSTKIPCDLLEKIKILTDEYMNNDAIVRLDWNRHKQPADINRFCFQAHKIGIDLDHIFNIEFKQTTDGVVFNDMDIFSILGADHVFNIELMQMTGEILNILNSKFMRVNTDDVYDDAKIINKYFSQILHCMVGYDINTLLFDEAVRFFRRNQIFLDSVMDKIKTNPAPQYLYYGLKLIGGPEKTEDEFLIIDNLVRSIMLHQEKYFKLNDAPLNKFLFHDINKLAFVWPDLDEEAKQELRKNPDVILIFMSFRSHPTADDFNQFVLEWRDKNALIKNTQMITKLYHSGHLLFQLPKDLLMKIAIHTSKHLDASESLAIVKNEMEKTGLTPQGSRNY